MIIVLDEHTPVSWNRMATLHFRKYQLLRNEVALLVAAATDPETPMYKGPVDIRVVAYNRKPLDVDNVAAKLYVDALRKRGVLCDDDPRYVRSLTVVSRTGEPKVELLLTLCSAK